MEKLFVVHVIQLLPAEAVLPKPDLLTAIEAKTGLRFIDDDMLTIGRHPHGLSDWIVAGNIPDTQTQEKLA